MQNYGNIICDAEKIKGEKIDLDFPSVGATENAILADGRTCPHLFYADHDRGRSRGYKGQENSGKIKTWNDCSDW